MFIYLTTNIITNKKYIGMCSRDASSYLGSGKLLKRAIKKFGKENFKREILQECSTFEELCEAEDYWITKYNAVESEDFYNLNKGGMGGNSELLKSYWSSLSKEERKTNRNWNGYFCNNVNSRELVYDNPNWRNNVSKGVAASWANLTTEEYNIRREAIKEGISNRDFRGNKNPMAGRSIVREKNLKWYTDGTLSIYVTEGTQPDGFHRGRKLKINKHEKF
jgi:hypothetical protein